MGGLALRALVALLAVALLGGTGQALGGQEDGEPLEVVATFSVVGDLVQNVGGDAIDLTTIIRPGVDAHNFEPMPQDAEAIADADVIFANGLEFEPWLEDLVEASGSDPDVVVVTDRITSLPVGAHDDGDEGAEHDEDGDGHQEGEEHQHGKYDPHVWHDVALAMKMVETIRDALVAAAPEDAPTFEANAVSYLDQLQALDEFVVAEVAGLPEERRKLVTSHDTFAYFAARYGFEIVGTAFGAISTEGGDPSAVEIAELVEVIEASGVPAIFAENVSNPALMEAIAAEAGVELAPTLYTDALGEPGSDGDTYEKMIRANVTTIVTALGQ